jgi:hypothetical protein
MDKEPDFFCCVVANNQPKCEKQCQFCTDWVQDAEEQSKELKKTK